MFSLICAWTNCWVHNRDTGDLRRHGAHYDVTVMLNWRIPFYRATSTRAPPFNNPSRPRATEANWDLSQSVTSYFNIPPDWLGAALPANQKICCKITVSLTDGDMIRFTGWQFSGFHHSDHVFDDLLDCYTVLDRPVPSAILAIPSSWLASLLLWLNVLNILVKPRLHWILG